MVIKLNDWYFDIKRIEYVGEVRTNSHLGYMFNVRMYCGEEISCIWNSEDYSGETLESLKAKVEMIRQRLAKLMNDNAEVICLDPVIDLRKNQTLPENTHRKRRATGPRKAPR